MKLQALTGRNFGSISHPYSARDTMLYALSVGAGADPLDPVDLLFTTQKGLVALPTMSCILASPGFWVSDPELEIDFVRFLHGEQAIELYKPLPPEGEVHGSYRVIGVKDRGAEKGATMWFEKLLKDDGGDTIAAVRSTYMLRGDGGCGDHGEALEAAPPLPDRAADRVIEIPTLARQALIYRLNGDYNPLHSDPEVAAKAGFDRPIMHGLGTMGIVCHALVRTFAGGDPARVSAMSQRFSKPFFPGETIALECFEEGGTIRFRAKAVERGEVVLDLGSFSLR